MKGKLIVLMGIDGSGKTTLLKNLEKYYNHNQNFKFITIFKKSRYTRELEKAAMSENKKVKECFSKELRNLAWRADIIDNMSRYVIPELEMGNIVILDRYVLCNRVIHHVKNKNREEIDKILEVLPKPDFGIYLDVEVETALERINSREKKKDDYENKENLLQLKQLYKKLIKNEGYNIITINANLPEEKVLKKTIDEIGKIINKEKEFEV